LTPLGRRTISEMRKMQSGDTKVGVPKSMTGVSPRRGTKRHVTYRRKRGVGPVTTPEDQE